MTTARRGLSGHARRAGPSRAAPAGVRRFFPSSLSRGRNPWHALWAMMVGFFMIMVDATIVAIANPTIMADLHIGYDAVVWVTSAYLLGYAVVLLVAGRLGDRFGTKNLYLIGLVVFTAASLWCGLSGSAGMLIAARVVQGIGAGVLTPQTLSTITRIFPPERRGVAVSLWGATAGVASLVGPLAGGVLVDGLGWEWIFFVNVPIGVVGLALAARLVPVLPTQGHRFDLVGVVLSGVGMFLIVFGLQQGQAAHWQPWIWATIVAGAGFFSVFVYWQSMNTREPLIPLNVFADRDFSLCNVGVAITSFVATAMMLPLTFYTQSVYGLSPTRSALLIAPMAIANGVLAPFVGRIVDRYHPRPVIGFGFSMLAIALTWLSFDMSPATPIWRLVVIFGAVGVGMAFVWSPLTATATRNLPPELAGTGSAVYNAVRQVGAVLGSAAMAAFMTWRIGAEMPRYQTAQDADTGATLLQLPEFVRAPFAAAMSESMLLPAFIALFGIAAALFLLGFVPALASRARSGGARAESDDDYGRYGSCEGYEGYEDDDTYVELILRREPDIRPAAQREPIAPRRAGEGMSPSAPTAFAHNGSRADGGPHTRPVVELPPHLSGPAVQPGRRPVIIATERRVNGATGFRRLGPDGGYGQHQAWGPGDDSASYGRHASR
ncbi:MFS transporter [Mycobacterium sherrisii]|uniref:MFS transporter n=1 Tax=Mycobacterium sherrisii TaxID=243061 RepID=UPI00398F26A0